MNKSLLFAFLLLVACGSDYKTDTMIGNGSVGQLVSGGSSSNSDEEVMSDAGISPRLPDGGRDIMACLKIYDEECLPVCLVLPNKTAERKSCLDNCVYEYRVCAGCYGEMPNE